MSGGYDVIVIGAGHNGLTAAARLAKSGRKVLIVERRNVIGGLAADEPFHPGYRSAGLLHHGTQVREKVVKALGLAAFGLRFESKPKCFYIPDRNGGRGMVLGGEPELAAEEIAHYSEADAGNYLKYRHFLDRVRHIIGDLFVNLPEDLSLLPHRQVWDLFKKGIALRRLGKNDMMELLRINFMCVADWLNEWFQTDLLKAGLALPALAGSYTGPWSPGNNLNLLMWESGYGPSVAGGPHALIDALRQASESSGVEIRAGASVQKILFDGTRARGVLLREGETLESRVVMASCDPKHTFFKLVDSPLLPYRLEKELSGYRMRGTTAKVNFALNGSVSFDARPGLAPSYIRVGTSIDDLERAFDPVKYGRSSDNFCLDIYVPTMDHPGWAPEGHSVISALVHFAPYHQTGGWTRAQKERLGDSVSKTLDAYISGFTKKVVANEVLSPLDLEARYGITEGHMYHGEQSVDQLLARPIPDCAGYRTPFQSLYLCGGGTAPGGGLTCYPGFLAADRVLKES